MTTKTIFISADHGLAIVYFLQSDVVPTLLKQGVQVVVLTDDGIKDQIQKRFEMPGLIFEGLRLKEARNYAETKSPAFQWWLNFFRRVGGSDRINVEAMDSHVEQVAFEATGRRRLIDASHAKPGKIFSRFCRSPQAPGTRANAFQPELCTRTCSKSISLNWWWHPHQAGDTTGIYYDRLLKGDVPTAAVIVGWDNPSSYSIPGAPVDWITCWSEVQKEELVLGSDWVPGTSSCGRYTHLRRIFSQTVVDEQGGILPTAWIGPQSQTPGICLQFYYVFSKLPEY